MIIETEYGSFDWVPGWGDLPAELDGHDVPGVAIGPSDRLYVLSRSSIPVVVLDRSGAFLSSWGEGDFVRPHGIHVAPDGSVWCADDEGQRLLRSRDRTGQTRRAISSEMRTACTVRLTPSATQPGSSPGPKKIFGSPTGTGTQESTTSIQGATS